MLPEKDFVTETVENLVNQIEEDGLFGEFVASSRDHDTIDGAIKVARNAISIDNRANDWAIFKMPNGKYLTEHAGCFVAERLKEGGVVVGIIDGFTGSFQDSVKEAA